MPVESMKFFPAREKPYFQELTAPMTMKHTNLYINLINALTDGHDRELTHERGMELVQEYLTQTSKCAKTDPVPVSTGEPGDSSEAVGMAPVVTSEVGDGVPTSPSAMEVDQGSNGDKTEPGEEQKAFTSAPIHSINRFYRWRGHVDIVAIPNFHELSNSELGRAGKGSSSHTFPTDYRRTV